MSSIAEEYEPLEVIGKGSFGTVRKVRQKDNGAILVRKEIEYTSMNTQEKNHIISELRILRELNHPHIVKYLRHDHIAAKRSIHIYQEYCDGGDLGHIISTFKRNKETVPEEFIWEVLVQTLLALHRCHYGIDSKKVNLFTSSAPSTEPTVDSETVIIHRDIKPENIFLLDSRKTIKLGDFGLAKMLTSQNDFAKTYVGTPYYMSPEVLMDNPYSPVCDIWSLGCVLFELCNLSPPFQAKTHLQLQTKIKHGVIPEVSPVYSQQLRNIICDSITVDPSARPTCFELLESISVKMFRKEMELNQLNTTLSDFQKQLLIKHEELKKREAVLGSKSDKQDAEKKAAMAESIDKREATLKALERQIQLQKQDLDRQVRIKKKELEDDYIILQKKCATQKSQLEHELMEEFEMRKRAMDQEGKEMRLFYQREFKHVVEQEVQLRVSEILQKKGYEYDPDLRRKKSDSSSASLDRPSRTQSPSKPKGPREFVEESTQNQHHQPQHHQTQHHQTQHQHYQTPQPHAIHHPYTHSPTSGASANFNANQHTAQYLVQHRRSPLKTRNTEEEVKSPRPNNYKKRITDEFERLNLQKRNIPEFEEYYMRQNHRH